MSLTPEDVVTKQFQHVRFKEGFDPDEVDDFLDEIVVEWRKTIEENEQLKARIAELEAGGAAAPAAEKAPAPQPEPTPEPAEGEGSDVTSTASSAAGIIARAERLHDEHVAERSEEHTSELQSRENLVCRLLLEKKKKKTDKHIQKSKLSIG